mmetsp:Transcript_25689/g.37777  ORF Transcript_25689/g.37777 Transcript_25689/m.37777 type:complete len:103 (-) Transcript_25689:167-475(-)|eukprot:scaffold844_cov125-Skeletonema_dohrnii-CCMP3373.AAC.1
METMPATPADSDTRTATVRDSMMLPSRGGSHWGPSGWSGYEVMMVVQSMCQEQKGGKEHRKKLYDKPCTYYIQLNLEALIDIIMWAVGESLSASSFEDIKRR